MKKNLYTLFTLVALLFAVSMTQAQVNVTYKVDVSIYKDTVPGGITANGMRVGGNFTDLGSTTPNWAPADAGCAMTDEGSNVWSITVTYPATAIGQTQQFKFVNGDWGPNEGLGPTTQIVTGGCGVADAGGNINRTIVIPASDLVLQYCYDMCTKCDGSSAVVSGIMDVPAGVASLDISPNLVNNYAEINYTLPKNGNVNIVVRGFDGRVVSSLVNKSQSPGSYNLDLVTDGLSNGVYFVQMNTAGVSVNKRFVINR